ncbi:MAG TPA: glutamate synthase-related protein [Anaerolineales bacterium]|nr:glutamate synthase-related protein [Anaerolineales bacterium]
MKKNQHTSLKTEDDQGSGAGTFNWLTAADTKTWLDERDACALVASVRKNGEATHGNLKRALAALSIMGHRSGEVNGEGDGCGVLTDIPRLLWAQALEQEGKPGWLAEDRRFFVGHLMIPNTNTDLNIKAKVIGMLTESGVDVLLERPIQTRPQALGKMARMQAPHLWQIAGLVRNGPLENVERTLFDLALKIEHCTKVAVASLSSYVVVYKVRGAIETLYQYYPELRNPDFRTAITIGHARYSTNTATSFERVQPFNLLGHNGEINTIARLREQSQMLGVELVDGGSDSQDLDRLLETLIHRYHFTLMEAMEIAFPPILSEVEKLSPDLQAIYKYYRQAFGPFAQGPAGIISRFGDECVFSVDALGLRPLWFGETEKEFFFSSEKGVYHLDTMRLDPIPLSPGEKMRIRVRRREDIEVSDYPAIQQRMLKLTLRRFGSLETINKRLARATFKTGSTQAATSNEEIHPSAKINLDNRMSAFGWGREDREWIQELAKNGADPISSLGFDGPLASLSKERQNISDYFKEAVAVVTNPAIDREREVEHFSTQIVIGERPPLVPGELGQATTLTFDSPLLVDDPKYFSLKPPSSAAVSIAKDGDGSRNVKDLFEHIENETGYPSLNGVVQQYSEEQVKEIQTVTLQDESTAQALERIAQTAVEAVRGGSQLIILNDADSFREQNGWLDPILVVGIVDRALRQTFIETPPATSPTPIPLGDNGKIDLGLVASTQQINLRRQVGVILRSGAIRNLHDLIMCIGMGADAVVPYLILEASLNDATLTHEGQIERLKNTLKALRSGIEKCTSTMGIHESRGYGRLFACIGLSNDIALSLGASNYGGSDEGGLKWEDLDTDLTSRKAAYHSPGRGELSRVNHFYPKIWKAAGKLGKGEADWRSYEEHVENTAKSTPVTIRNVLDFNFPEESTVQPDKVDLGITSHRLPFLIASMSFGSQGEVAYRAYAEAAFRLNMLSLNGEGGEIPDLLGKYPFNRGIQIASGRFGITAETINATNLIEIKVGQGAKPGEGGHLPARKVTQKVAAARHARPGVDLISPSNNHDIYSIEDLAQFIEELKTINPKARVAVKVPVVPGIGIIAIGIAKADADIIYLTGYDGGTGAARSHSLRYVGLPAEIGVVDAHRALTDSGLRDKVEIWADGGVRSASDVIKLMCLGANRVGFGTLPMVAIGCTICRDCQLGTCHTGITTQLETTEQAHASGVKHFVPRDFEQAVEALVNVFNGLGEAMQATIARLGFEHAQDIVGRSDLLQQISHHEKIDLREMLVTVDEYLNTKPIPVTLPVHEMADIDRGPLHRPRNHLTTVISNLVMESFTTYQQDAIRFEDDKVTPVDRALGTHLTGALTRFSHKWSWAPGHGGVGGHRESWRQPVDELDIQSVPTTALRFFSSSVPGNGLGAYNADPVRIIVEGGAQDGVAKGISGGRVIILKGYNHDGKLIDGSVGKGLAYGGTAGIVIVQGNADSRACIRLSGADVVIGGEITKPLNDSLGFIGARANIKGFLCEYMTSGRVVVLGDPGPWMCAGMTGGVLYLRLQPHLNFDQAAIQRRLAKGAKVQVQDVGETDLKNLRELLTIYAEELRHNHQSEEAQKIVDLLVDWKNTFVRVVPLGQQEEQRFATE